MVSRGSQNSLRIGVGAAGVLLEVTAKEPPSERRPRDHTDTHVLKQGDHFSLLLTVDRIVQILHGDELSEVVLTSIRLHLMD